MNSYTKHFNLKSTPQTEPIPEANQVKNSAGGWVYVIDDWIRLDRWLCWGSPGGSYYASEQKLTRENAECVVRCLKEDGSRTVARIVEVSEAGRAPKNAPAVFALAICASLGDQDARRLAFTYMPRVARTGTDLFAFVEACQGLRGWGRGLKDGVANWYTSKDANAVAYQCTKYAQREGISHRDILRLCHARTDDPALQAVFRWITRQGMCGERAVRRLEGAQKQEFFKTYPPVQAELPGPIVGAERAKKSSSPGEIVRLIHEYNLVREVIPTNFLNAPEVWEALLEKMPMTAMVRNLAKMTSIGLISPLSDASRKVASALGNVEAIRKARLHPLSLLVALEIYQQGHGEKGSLKWSPDQAVCDALDRAFYLAFDAVEPTNKNWMLALDVSGSMGWGNIAGMPGITPRIGSAAMALVTASVEKNWHVVGYSTSIAPINISPRQRLDDAIRVIKRVPMGGTDCAQPMLYATKNRIPVDVFVSYTDSETYTNPRCHPIQALHEYRQKMGRPAKLIVCAMMANQFSIADPNDGGCMDVCGFSTDCPQVMADFARS